MPCRDMHVYFLHATAHLPSTSTASPINYKIIKPQAGSTSQGNSRHMWAMEHEIAWDRMSSEVSTLFFPSLSWRWFWRFCTSKLSLAKGRRTGTSGDGGSLSCLLSDSAVDVLRTSSRAFTSWWMERHGAAARQKIGMKHKRWSIGNEGNAA